MHYCSFCMAIAKSNLGLRKMVAGLGLEMFGVFTGPKCVAETTLRG